MHVVGDVLVTQQELDDLPRRTVVPELSSIYFSVSNPPRTPCVPKVPVRNCRTLLPVFKANGALVIIDREHAPIAVFSTYRRCERVPRRFLDNRLG